MPQPGELWLAEIPFTNGLVSKIRPVLLLWQDAADVVVAAVTSAGPRSPTDVPLREWVAAGLRVASTVRLSRLDCLEVALLRRRLGAVSTSDAAKLKRIWAADFALNDFAIPVFDPNPNRKWQNHGWQNHQQAKNLQSASEADQKRPEKALA